MSFSSRLSNSSVPATQPRVPHTTLPFTVPSLNISNGNADSTLLSTSISSKVPAYPPSLSSLSRTTSTAVATDVSTSVSTQTGDRQTVVPTSLVSKTQNSSSPIASSPCGGCIYYMHMSLTTANLGSSSPTTSIVLSDYRIESSVTASSASACQTSLVSSLVLNKPTSFALPSSSNDTILSSLASGYIASRTIPGCGSTPLIQLSIESGAPNAASTPTTPQTTPAGPPSDHKTTIGIGVGVGVSMGLLSLVGLTFLYFFLRKRRSAAKESATIWGGEPSQDMLGILVEEKMAPVEVQRSLRLVGHGRSRSEALIPSNTVAEAEAQQQRELDVGYRGTELRNSPTAADKSSNSTSLKPLLKQRAIEVEVDNRNRRAEPRAFPLISDQSSTTISLEPPSYDSK